MSTTSLMPFNSGFTGASPVPSSGEAVTSPQIDPSTLIQNISPDLIRAAATPIAGAHATPVPSNFTTPITPYQPAPMDRTPVVGRGAGRARGIGNAIIGATNALGAVVTAEAQVKQNQVKDAAQKVITAQAAIDEAQQQHDMAAAAGDTKQAEYYQGIIDKNKGARDGVFADPKMKKALQKGFDISYTDPQSNKTPEHAAVQEAMKAVQAAAATKDKQQIAAAQAQLKQAQGAEAGAAFAKGQPQSLAPNTVAQSQYAAAAAQQKIQQEAYKDYTNFQASIYRSDKTVEAAQVREIGAGILQAARYGQAQDLLNQRMAQQEKLLGERYSQEMSLVQQRAKAARETAMDVFRDKEADPLDMYNKSRLSASTYAKNALADGESLTKLMASRQSLYVDSKGNQISEGQVDQNAVKALDMQVQSLKTQIQIDQANAKNFADQASKLQGTFGLSEGSSDDGRSSSSSGESQSDSVGEPDYTDPLTYLNAGSEDDSK